MMVYFACFVVGFTAKMLLDDHMALLREQKKEGLNHEFTII